MNGSNITGSIHGIGHTVRIADGQNIMAVRQFVNPVCPAPVCNASGLCLDAPTGRWVNPKTLNTWCAGKTAFAEAATGAMRMARPQAFSGKVFPAFRLSNAGAGSITGSRARRSVYNQKSDVLGLGARHGMKGLAPGYRHSGRVDRGIVDYNGGPNPAALALMGLAD